MSNHFEATINRIQDEVENDGDLETTLNRNAAALVGGPGLHPLDCGLKRWRSSTITLATASPGQSVEPMRRFLLVVRGTLENGDDVVAFFNASNWIGCYVEFAWQANSQSIDWKEDRKSEHRGRGQSFMDAIASGRKSTNAVRNGDR